MIESGEGDFCEEPETIDLVANQVSYNLATLMSFSPIKVRMVERKYSTQWVVLRKWEKNTGSIDSTGVGSGEFFPSYRFTNTKLTFNMIPNFSEDDTVRIEGYKLPVEMSADADVPNANFHEAYHNLLVLWATVAALETKEAVGTAVDKGPFAGRLQAMEEQFIASMNNRSDCPESVDPFIVEGEEF